MRVFHFKSKHCNKGREKVAGIEILSDDGRTVFSKLPSGCYFNLDADSDKLSFYVKTDLPSVAIDPFTGKHCVFPDDTDVQIMDGLYYIDQGRKEV